MKFYEIDNALLEAIEAADKPVRLKVEIKLGDHFESFFEQDIIYANFYSLNEVAGGVSSRAEILLSGNRYQVIGNSETAAGREVRVSFSIGEGLTYFHRFTFFVDDKGFQYIRGNGRKRFIYIGLQDLSYKLRKTDEARDWSNPAVFTYSIICDKSQPNKSLVHGIAQRAGLSVTDIDCSTIPVTLPYVKLRRNIWSELSSLATAYRCHLECAVEKPLVFAHSPYQISEQGAGSSEQTEECSYIFSGDNIFYLRVTEKAELYRNTVRLKINIPVSLEKQEIWRYDEPPVFYDEGLAAYYPFRNTLEREIEATDYEAKYRVKGDGGQGTGDRTVVYADQIDTKQEAENRIQMRNEEGEMRNENYYYSHYDITTYNDRAILKVQKEEDCDLYVAAIHGRPVVLDLNRSCFLRDEDGIANYGTVALNVTGSYFSEYEIEGKPQYEDWVVRELAERTQNKREFTVKTHKALFNARVGAKVQIQVTGNREQVTGTINEIAFRYKRARAFVSMFKIREGM